MKFSRYFQTTSRRPDRREIRGEWIRRVVESPEDFHIQPEDGRIRLWGRVPEAGGKWLRVILLPDGETVHNAFFDRRFRPRPRH